MTLQYSGWVFCSWVPYAPTYPGARLAEHLLAEEWLLFAAFPGVLGSCQARMTA